VTHKVQPGHHDSFIENLKYHVTDIRLFITEPIDTKTDDQGKNYSSTGTKNLKKNADDQEDFSPYV